MGKAERVGGWKEQRVEVGRWGEVEKIGRLD